MTIKFKDFLNTNYTPGEDEQIALNAKKRKKDISTSEDLETEALSTPERLKRGRQMKRNKTKIKIGREKAARRFASPDVLKRRAQKQARKQVANKLAKGDKSDMSPQRKAEIEKRMDRPEIKSRILRIAKKLMPKMRRAEMERKRGKASKPSEDRM
jgi:hypothetical protein